MQGQNARTVEHGHVSTHRHQQHDAQDRDDPVARQQIVGGGIEVEKRYPDQGFGFARPRQQPPAQRPQPGDRGLQRPLPTQGPRHIALREGGQHRDQEHDDPTRAQHDLEPTQRRV
ncbi:hypothetical protein [Nocardia sp. CDC160]|uniref:hypothetical protein n=1 Tax=Nocardia sp. CDC160 TaxID=3112166 RepID=UPI002DBF227B|nr:hypothetical protein [Nocardia sp. CDC160]MEC3915670.1 hypothetical protein [Nocardia sp. CDC160]